MFILPLAYSMFVLAYRYQCTDARRRVSAQRLASVAQHTLERHASLTGSSRAFGLHAAQEKVRKHLKQLKGALRFGSWP
jgi:hypothetical protein